MSDPIAEVIATLKNQRDNLTEKLKWMTPTSTKEYELVDTAADRVAMAIKELVVADALENQPAHRKLVRFLLGHEGVTLSVGYDDGLDYELERTTDEDEVCLALEAADMASLYAHVGKKTEWAMVIPYGVHKPETVADFTCNGLIDQWFEGGGGETDRREQ